MNKNANKIHKSCPRCGSALIVRTNSESGSQFLGCSGWPDCKHTEPLPEDIRLRQAGAVDLFAWASEQDESESWEIG